MVFTPFLAFHVAGLFVAPDSRSSVKVAKSLTRVGATRLEGRGEHPASVVDRQELASK